MLISPGARWTVSAIAPNVSWIQVYGAPVGRGESRYRILLDLPAVRAVVTQVRPDVMEVHDPWVSAPFGLWLRRQGAFRGLLTSFCHSDPVTTYMTPRLAGLIGDNLLARRLTNRADLALRRLQAHFDIAFTASDTMQRRLSDGGVPAAIKVGFGVEPAMLAAQRSEPSPPWRRRILYAGRLDDDKEFGMVLAVLPDLLRRRDVTGHDHGDGRSPDAGHGALAPPTALPWFRRGSGECGRSLRGQRHPAGTRTIRDVWSCGA